MKKLIFILFCSSISATTITSNASGNWATGATWVGGVAPGDGDSAIIANGHTVTIPISTTVTVGSSPTTSGTAAIATSSTSGTGKLIVNGTLIYKGPIDLSADTVVGPGAILTHDSSAGADQTYPANDLTIGGSGTTLTSSAHAFANTADAGKTLSITGGTNCTVQLIYIISVTSGAALMSASPGTNGATCTGKMLPNYFWRQSRTSSLNSTLFLNGTSGSRFTANIAAGSAPSGGFWTLPAVTDSGLIQATYGDFFDCGLQAGPASTSDGYYCLFGAPITSGRTFSLDHVTFTRYARVGVGAIGTSTTSSITNCNFPASWQNFNNNNVEFGNNALPITSVKTSGTRAFTGNYVFGGSLQIRASIASNGLKTGITVQNNYFHNSGTTKIEITATTGPPVMQVDEFKDNIFWHSGPDQPATQPNFNPPAGLLKHSYSLYDNTSNPGGTSATCTGTDQNYHTINTAPGTTIIENWVFEPECATGFESNSVLILTAANWGSAFTTTLRGNIWLPANVGGGGFNPVLMYLSSGLSTCNTSFWCPTLDYHHNTAYSGGPVPLSGSGGGVGVGAEATGGFRTNMVNGIYANIWWQSTSRAGAIEGFSGAFTPVTGMFGGLIDYDWTYNQTGTLYGWIGSAGYATTPGTHNQSGDPQFVAPTRNFLNWCKTLNGADASWANCEAHFALRGTSSDDSRYNGMDLVDWVRAGFRPNNRTTWNAGPTGGYVGAVEVNTISVSGKVTGSGKITIK